MNATDPELARAIDAIAVPGIAIEHRLIAEGDETALLPDEMAAFATSVVKVQRASGAARLVARRLLSRVGRPPQAIRKLSTGVPVWPDGLVGSLAHDDRVAVAALASRHDFLSIGIDVEPAQPIASDLIDIIATPGERAAALADPYRGRLLFCIKEAIYKAAYPLDRRFLEHHDVEVNLPAGVAQIRDGRQVRFRYCAATHIVALAFVPSLDASAT